jgi:hypothetical protein
MRRVEFDYANTCPKIDKAIEGAKADIERFLEGLINEICPFIPESAVSKLARENAESLYHDLQDSFESVRSANEDMRKEADRQIGRLNDEICDLEMQVKDLEARVE